ncbi:uncharacterized protein BDZ99DRAFT_527044 [Mytilinidion resinicola]|uniref:Uncharacterized protein n=1 Tax=Mytilinidion resinicola TaxID=574789 RepID=A0A6A6Y2Q7_9PEZI|nr:uncharacterized protein BDZ99DRAFT_527044 [Mytilinidion resinicola]KAF2802950.1 hypothetical protein BDZ99DRAFT_527044 [Mytilinidion resinicola]
MLRAFDATGVFRSPASPQCYLADIWLSEVSARQVTELAGSLNETIMAYWTDCFGVRVTAILRAVDGANFETRLDCPAPESTTSVSQALNIPASSAVCAADYYYLLPTSTPPHEVAAAQLPLEARRPRRLPGDVTSSCSSLVDRGFTPLPPHPALRRCFLRPLNPLSGAAGCPNRRASSPARTSLLRPAPNLRSPSPHLLVTTE